MCTVVPGRATAVLSLLAGAYFDWRGICTAVRQPWRRIPQQLVSAMSEKSERAGARQFVRKLR